MRLDYRSKSSFSNSFTLSFTRIVQKELSDVNTTEMFYILYIIQLVASYFLCNDIFCHFQSYIHCNKVRKLNARK